MIKVTGAAGSQQGAGQSNNITILEDGSDGVYRFFVSQIGTYDMELILPEGMSLSATRAPMPELPLVSLLPDNPAYLGSSGDSEGHALLDDSFEANPFALRFIIDEGSPYVFNNNIPLANCSAPEISLELNHAHEPQAIGEGRFKIEFEISIINTGDSAPDHISLEDNFAQVYGSNNFTILDIRFDEAVPFEVSKGSDLSTAIPPNMTLMEGQSMKLYVVASVKAQEPWSFDNEIAVHAMASNAAHTEVSDEEMMNFVFEPNVQTEAQEFEVAKYTSHQTARFGDQIPYEIRVQQLKGSAGAPVNLIDQLPEGLLYSPGSARVNGVAVEPMINGRDLFWTGLKLQASAPITITYLTRITSTNSSSTLTNRAYLLDQAGKTISNIAQASIEIKGDPAFECSDLFGKVFLDLNENNVQDQGERGLGQIKLVTIDGKVITTDKFGRYSLPCAMRAEGSNGANFILKLDPRSLPVGY